VERDPFVDGVGQVAVALARAGEADRFGPGAGLERKVHLTRRGDVDAVDPLRYMSQQWRIRICFHGIMKVNAGEKGAEGLDPGIDQIEVVDEQWGVAGLVDQRVGPA